MRDTDVALEVERLHQVFERWFSGEQTDLSAFTDRLAESFYLVSPRGVKLSRTQIIESVRSGFGAREVTIEVRSPCVEATIRDVVIVTYEEHQIEADARTARLSTAVLRREDAAPGGFLWEAVHETWMVDQAER